jgi:hypothetical protein
MVLQELGANMGSRKFLGQISRKIVAALWHCAEAHGNLPPVFCGLGNQYRRVGFREVISNMEEDQPP